MNQSNTVRGTPPKVVNRPHIEIRPLRSGGHRVVFLYPYKAEFAAAARALKIRGHMLFGKNPLPGKWDYLAFYNDIQVYDAETYAAYAMLVRDFYGSEIQAKFNALFPGLDHQSIKATIHNPNEYMAAHQPVVESLIAKYKNTPTPLEFYDSKHMAEGVAMLLSMFDHPELKGFILADEQGMAKTLQIIIACIERGLKRVLIVSTKSGAAISWPNELYKAQAKPKFYRGGPDKLGPSSMQWALLSWDDLRRFSAIEKVIANRRRPPDSPPIEGIEEAWAEIKEMASQFELLVLDEGHYCFPYETLVLTDQGKLPIGYIVDKKLNVNVASCNLVNNELEWKKIKTHFHRETNDPLIRIGFKNKEVICTSDHPIWTEEHGYIKAKDTTPGMHLRLVREEVQDKDSWSQHRTVLLKNMCRKENNVASKSEKNSSRWVGVLCSIYKKTKRQKNLLVVQKNIQHTSSDKKNTQTPSWIWPFLFEKLCKFSQIKSSRKQKEMEDLSKPWPADDYRITPSGCLDSHETEQPNVESKNSKKNAKQFTWKNFSFPRWKWETDKAANRLSAKTRSVSVDGISHTNKTSGRKIPVSSELLQGGHSQSNQEAGHRSGRELSPDKKMEISGPKENRDFECTRVERVEIYKPRSELKSRERGGKGESVYNIEVEDNHNYFANDVLVSNCQDEDSQRSIGADCFAKFIPHVVPATGTPVAKRPRNAYNLLRLVGHPLAKDKDAFLARYEGEKDDQGNTLMPQRREELHHLLQDAYIRREKSQTNLPPKTRPVQKIFLTEEDLEAMDQMWEKFLKENEQEIAKDTYPLASVKEGQYHKYGSIRKAIYVADWAEDLAAEGEKVTLFTNYTEVYNYWMKRFRARAAGINGAVEDRKPQEHKFMTDPRCMFFCGNIIAAGESITLTVSHILGFNDITNRPKDMLQAEDRNHRGGQYQDCEAHYFVANFEQDQTRFDRFVGDKEVIQSIANRRNADGTITDAAWTGDVAGTAAAKQSKLIKTAFDWEDAGEEPPKIVKPKETLASMPAHKRHMIQVYQAKLRAKKEGARTATDDPGIVRQLRAVLNYLGNPKEADFCRSLIKWNAEGHYYTERQKAAAIKLLERNIHRLVGVS